MNRLGVVASLDTTCNRLETHVVATKPSVKGLHLLWFLTSSLVPNMLTIASVDNIDMLLCQV